MKTVFQNQTYAEARAKLDNTRLGELRHNKYTVSDITVGKIKYPVIAGYPNESRQSISDKLKYLISGTKN
ncbi:MAG: hypothetical protein GX851_00915 [Clostridiales bacterium]|nr:hypothetical protein [Clostridiales bacterium]